MSGIAGFFHPDFIFQKENEQVKNTIENMSLALRRRGPTVRNSIISRTDA